LKRNLLTRCSSCSAFITSSLWCKIHPQERKKWHREKHET
jgi:hypothetical protein